MGTQKQSPGDFPDDNKNKEIEAINTVILQLTKRRLEVLGTKYHPEMLPYFADPLKMVYKLSMEYSCNGHRWLRPFGWARSESEAKQLKKHWYFKERANRSIVYEEVPVSIMLTDERLSRIEFNGNLYD